ncbi:Hsp70 family protein [Domibacillus sp. PGB-M46]|uniref:Hsp70 family protein n=1 Tax=Domibacillus sp. PGB-M46 TaxID=2910255 RepID=UPI001F59945B|nr:Hsp70 family protein [Domibacillus sp. PGB-M46]MCI2254784.1 Hsp70 family protein [Domibacillus sp. PGB-M46]
MSIIEKNSPYVLGIDLGTSNSAVSIYRKGQPLVIKLGKEETIPSVVSFRTEEDIQVGEAAKRRILIDPENTVSFIKREMGTEWKKEFYGNTYRPEDISAEILSKIKEYVINQEEVDLKGTPAYAVICVPANFDDNKKRATKEAAELSGLTVTYLLEEPVAAAIAYGTETSRSQTIMVYDLGGGTFDVSIMKVDSTSEDEPATFSILAKEGDPALGGYDIDQAIMKLVADDFKEKSKLDLFDLEADQGVSVRELLEAQQKLQEACEQAKKELSEMDEAAIEIPNIIKDENGVIHNVDFDISRADFEQVIEPLIDQTINTMKKALEQAKLDKSDISRVILAGGSSRVPLVRSKIKEMMGREPFSNINPDTVVAQGAAIYGASLGVPTDKLPETTEQDQEDKPDTDIKMNNIVTHHLGIEIRGGRFDTIVEKGVELNEEQPAVVEERLYSTPEDGMTEMRFTVFQSVESVSYVNEESSVCIGEFFLTGIPAAPKGTHRIAVEFEVNQQNEVIVTASLKGDKGVSSRLAIKRD